MSRRIAGGSPWSSSLAPSPGGRCSGRPTSARDPDGARGRPGAGRRPTPGSCLGRRSGDEPRTGRRTRNFANGSLGHGRPARSPARRAIRCRSVMRPTRGGRSGSTARHPTSRARCARINASSTARRARSLRSRRSSGCAEVVIDEGPQMRPGRDSRRHLRRIPSSSPSTSSLMTNAPAADASYRRLDRKSVASHPGPVVVEDDRRSGRSRRGSCVVRDRLTREIPRNRSAAASSGPRRPRDHGPSAAGPRGCAGLPGVSHRRTTVRAAVLRAEAREPRRIGGLMQRPDRDRSPDRPCSAANGSHATKTRS